jgi:osmotically-inducible protein OsmY
MRTDDELRRDVEWALQWEPSVDERRIGVSVIDGIVTLSGDVESYGERWKAERTVERVPGVRGIANELEVRTTHERTDTDIARAALDALKWSALVPADQLKVKVENGWLTLTGAVRWEYQRRAAERAVRNLAGVKGFPT